ncbi:hypothetical protein ASPWEDRAFT_185366 [Aspergillus wentii DTO 134E9]|uniref:MACPF-like domain-containing protein n=1 Tax=Aspergillus wentii DTO 134E9 TaxID=1073089 RepID=A0A1L9RD88_ASPWE|nr:uncharacterized protein ASPWEDRAFT_185366 [Aspergillus wentii DTO 134E9]OJJ32909.1 hypothetical protein ASPWEDRAFT_185366 [Aspergillus wentii DTO 134E9]
MSGIRFDVHLFDASDEKSKRTNCVPLKEFDVGKAKLSEVRSALIDNGGLDASKAGFSFCSSSGALVSDATLFADYLEILGEGSEDDEEVEKEKKETPDEKEETINKKKKTASKAIYNIYIFLKAKKAREDLAKEAKELRKELNLKLSDKPELLKASLEQLESSFAKADWLAKANKTTTNPAEMSEQEWSAVIRNNSLTSASRLVFSNLGREPDGTQKVRFRRIERAPYSAFVLKPRKFQPHEIGDTDIKVEQQFYIPRFVVTDDSYVDVFETKTSVATEMARSSFSSREAELSIEGGAFGVSAAASGGFSKNQSDALSTTNTADSSTMNVTYNFPRVVMHLDQHSLDLSEECSNDLAGVRDVNSLLAFHHKYGHFFATRVELGGRLFSSEKLSVLGASSQSEAAKAMKIAANLSFSSKYASGSARYGQEDQENTSGASSDRSMQKSISWQAQGGDTLLCNNPPEWCPTVAPAHNWRVIKQEDIIPLGEFMGLIPGYEDVPTRFARLTEVTRRKEKVGFHLRLAESSPIKYLSLVHAWAIHDEVSKLYKAQAAEGFERGEIQPPAHLIRYKLNDNKMLLVQDGFMASVIQNIYDNGEPGLSFEPDGDQNVFEIEVETVLNQAPTIRYQRRYRIFNLKRGLWLRAVTIPSRGQEITLLTASYEGEATLFEFRDGDREGPVHNGDNCQVIVYGADGRSKGWLGYSLRDEKNENMVKDSVSIGALPLSSPISKRIPSLIFETVDLGESTVREKEGKGKDDTPEKEGKGKEYLLPSAVGRNELAIK